MGRSHFKILNGEEIMQEIILKTPAKINWTLDVVRKREDGYHDISTIMQSVAIYDEITIHRIPEREIKVGVSDPNIPEGKENIAYKAAELMLDRFKIDEGLHIYIDKNIPSAAGLGGGSSDGAAVMLGIKSLYDIDITFDELAYMGSTVGADIPFCILGGTALAEGIGEKLTQLPFTDEFWLVIIKPDFNISTGEIYAHIKIDDIANRPDNNGFIQALCERELERMARYGHNVLEEVSAKFYPGIYDIKSDLYGAGAVYTLMSGSGPSVFGVFKTRDEAKKAYCLLKYKYEHIFLTHTISKGPTIQEV